MLMYIKSRKDFRTTYKAYSQGWSVPVMASTNERGTVMIPLEGRKDFAGDILYFDGRLYLLDESSPKDGIVELTVSDMVNLFSRQVKYPANPVTTSYGDFITDIIETNFQICPEDDVYSIPYLRVTNSDMTEFEEPQIQSTGLFSLVDVIAKAKEKGVLFTWSIIKENGSDCLELDISSPITVPHNIVFDDGHTTLESETFSRSKTAKITTIWAQENADPKWDDWYLSKSGEVCDSEHIPEDRADGDWIYLQVNKEDDPETKAKEEFKKNISSHKIEFYSDRTYYLWDTVRFTIDGELLESAIVSIALASDNKRYLYKCGDLATTLTEKVQKIS